MDPEKYEKFYGMETWDECINYLYLTKELADFTLVTRSGLQQASFAVHKWILCISSFALKQLISSPDAVLSDSASIGNDEPEAVELMLCHIYKRKISFSSMEQALDVLSLAMRYRLSVLEKLCESYIEDFINASNACIIYERTFHLKHEDLFYKSFKYIQKETSKVLKQTDLKNMHSSTLETILRQNNLNIDSEFELLETLIDWAKLQLKVHEKLKDTGNLRKLVYPFLKHIRFLIITKEMVFKIQDETEIFYEEDLSKILMKLFNNERTELPTWFNQLTTPRGCKQQVSYMPETIPLNKWHNLNEEPHSHSDFIRKATSTFFAKNEGFYLRHILLSICDKCLQQNSRSKRSDIKMNITLRTEKCVHNTQWTIFMLPEYSMMIDVKELDFNKHEPLILRKQYDNEQMIYRKHVQMEAPVLESYLDPNSRFSTHVNIAPLQSKTITVPPIYIKDGDWFSLSMETQDNMRFYCCKKRPLFRNAPFTVFSQITKEEYLHVWCAFASIGYSLCKSKASFHKKLM